MRARNYSHETQFPNVSSEPPAVSPGFTPGIRPDPHRISRRSMSRPPPAGSIESSIDVMDVLKQILGTQEPIKPLDDSPTFVLKASAIDPHQRSIQHLSQDTPVIDHDYKSEMVRYTQLHDQIATSDSYLDSLEVYLSSFQKDLTALSSDMETLQNQSLVLTRQMDSRKQAETKLAPLVEALVIPPPIVKQIVDGDISSLWAASLQDVSRHKIQLEELKKKEGSDLSAIKAANEQLELISAKACERIRDFVVTRIKSMRVAGINAQSIQSDMLTYAQLFEFLHQNNPQLSSDLQRAYINTMKWYYHSYFSRYIKSLERLKMHIIDRTVLLGTDDTRRGLFYGRSTTTSQTLHNMDYLTVGTRVNIITSDDPSVMLASNAESNPMTCYMETGFRSLNLAFLDNASVEYQFLGDFFKFDHKDEQAKTFNQIFEPTFQLGQEYTKFLIGDSFDAYGVLICIRLCRKLEFELQRRRVPVMENYLNLQLINLWPRLQSIMDAHCDSLRRASTRSSFFAAAQATSTTPAPHHLTQTFASLISGILTLCEDESENEPVANSLLRLRNDFEAFITKVSAALGNDNNKGSNTKRERFLYNNYFLVVTVLADVPGKLAEQERVHFDLLTKAYEQKS